jgi:hypothetical protein
VPEEERQAMSHLDPIKRFLAKIEEDPSTGCWNWTADKVPSGHGLFWHNGTMVRAHRFALSLVQRVPDGDYVLHACVGNPSCCNPAHLYLGDQKQNMKDREDQGRTARGSQNGKSKLSEEDVQNIRRLRKSGLKNKEIASLYGVCDMCVSNIRTGRTWSQVK